MSLAHSIFLAHITVTDTLGVGSTLYVSDEPVRPFASDDAVAANRIYNPILIEAANIRRDLFGDVTRGGGEVGYGVMRLSNADSGLSYLRPYVFGTVKVYRYVPGMAFNQAQLLFSGRVSRPNWTHAAKTTASLTLNLVSDFKVLERDLQTDLYAGTAAAGYIYEGESGLEGRPKPISMGDLSTGHTAGILVAPGAQVWHLSNSTIASIDTVYDRGDDAGYTSDGDLTGAAFDGATPASAKYVTDLGRGMIKLGGNPVGAVGFSLTENAAATPRALIKRLLLSAGIAAANIGASLDVLGGPVCGLQALDKMSINDAVRFLATSEMAAIGPDRHGVWQYRTLVEPLSGLETYSLPYDDILDLSQDGGEENPVARVRIGYDRNHQVLNRDAIAPAVHGTARESWLNAEWRFALAENVATLADYPNYRELEILTPIRSKADAQILADKILETLGTRPSGGVRENLRLVMALDTARLGVSLGNVVALDYPPADIARNYVLIGIELNRPRTDQMIWRVWG